MSDTGRTPCRNFRAYRRKAANGDVWLIVEGYFYEIDEMLDRIWLAIDGKTSVEDIARQVFADQDPGEAHAQTEEVLAQMVELGLVEWSGQAAGT